MGDYVVPVSSPLDALARRTSRRRPTPVQTPLSQPGSGDDPRPQYTHVPILDAPPKRPFALAPQSPLLHTRFRASVATQSSLNTSNELCGPRMAGGAEDFPYEDDISIYSTSDPTPDRLSNSVRSPAELEQISELSGGVQDRSTSSLQPSRGVSSPIDGRRQKNGMMDPRNLYQGSPSNNSLPLPIVVVSSEAPEEVVDDHGQGWGDVLSSPIAESHSVGHTPSTQRKHLNFSRPMRAGGASEDTKHQVLARNAFRRSAFTRPSAQSPQPSLGAPPPHSREISPSRKGQQVPENPLNTSISSNALTSSLIPTRPAPKPPVAAGNQLAPLLHDPPRVSSSPTSLYSMFSYYELDSPPSSTSDSLRVPASPHMPQTTQRVASPMRDPAPRADSRQVDLADQLLQEGIRHHEANRLGEAANAFEKSARTPGGSGVGMLMWGLTLRHGWGCTKDESLGFSWLRRAAEAAVGDLERARAGLDISAVRGELVLAIYEVGQCFFQGWGVKKDQKMAVVSCQFYSYMFLEYFG
jgi:hypothetical protein